MNIKFIKKNRPPLHIKKLWLILILLCSNITIFARYKQFFLNEYNNYHMTIMLDPAGDSHHVGRTIDDCFERGLTLQCAEELKKQLELNYPGLRVILTRNAAQTVRPLQHANFANRMNIDLYLSIHFYHELSPKPNLYVYYFSYGNDLCSKTLDVSFYPYEQAYIFCKDKTSLWANRIKKELSQQAYTALFDAQGPYALPFKPLIGIKAPAIAIEASLKQADDWHLYIKPIIASLDSIVTDYQQKESTA